MATVETLTIDVKASVDKAVSSLKKFKGAMTDVASANSAAAKTTKESVTAFEATASGLQKAAQALRGAGLKNLAKEFGKTAELVNFRDLKNTTKALMEAADEFAKKGDETTAKFIRDRSDLVAKERELIDAERQLKRAEEEIAEAQAKVKQAQETSAKSELAYVELTKKAQLEKADAILKSYTDMARRIAKENEDSDRAYAELTKAERNRQADARIKQIIEEAQARQAALQKAQADREAAEAAAKRDAEEAKLNKQLEKQARHERRAKNFKELAKGVESVGKAFKNLGNIMPKITSKFFGIFRMFGRIAMYRAVRAAIKALTSAIKEGLTNLKAYSQEVGTAFAPAVDNLRSHVLWLKNAFATALRPVLEALMPLIQRLVDWLVKAADFMAQVFSIMTGKVDANGRYTKAVLTDIQESNKEAKKLQRTLLGFDEINRLDGDNGTDNTQNAGLMFTQADVGEKAKEWAARLTEWLAKAKEIINGIDWKLILDVLIALKAAEILKKVADWVGAISKLLGGSGGVVALALALGGAFALWGDEIQKFIESTGINKVNEFFENLKKPFGKKGLMDTWLSNGQIDIDYILRYVGNIAKLFKDLFHGDINGALEDSKKAFGDYFAYLIVKIDTSVGFIWDKIVAPVLNWCARATYNVYRGIYNTIIDIEIALNKAMTWVLQRWNEVLWEIEKKLNTAIAAINLITGKNIEPINLHVDMREYYDAIDELENKKLPELKENVKIYGTWEQTKALLNIDTSEAERKIYGLSYQIKEMIKLLAESLGTGSKGNNNGKGIGSNAPKLYASGGFPAMGTLFVAGEMGAEWVGDINGRTGVMNTDQMADAMYAAMTAALANNPQGGDIYLDGEVIYRNTVRRNNNYVRSTGRTALLT